MKEDLFKVFLESEGLTTNGVNYRMSKARKVEAVLGQSLDTLVASDAKMEHALRDLKPHDSARSPLQNALRKYYKFEHKKEFPRMKTSK